MFLSLTVQLKKNVHKITFLCDVRKMQMKSDVCKPNQNCTNGLNIYFWESISGIMVTDIIIIANYVDISIYGNTVWKKNGSGNDSADSPNYLNDHKGCFKHLWEVLLWILWVLISSLSSCDPILTYGECSLLLSSPLSMLKCLRLQLERCKLCFWIP